MKDRIWKIIWKILTPWLKKRKMKDIIFIESVPDFTDNPRCVFDEMIRRGLNKKYKIIWCLNGKEKNKEFSKIKNVYQIRRTQRIHKYVSHLGKMIISSNRFLVKRRDDQYHICLAHGAAMKNCQGHYSLPKDIDEALCFSDYMGYFDSLNYSCSHAKMRPLGYPRNDILFEKPIDLAKIFPETKFKKVVYWLPTYRQHRNGKNIHSDITMPILYTPEIAQQVNDFAKLQQILLVVKPHPAQDVSKIKEIQLSHLKFIDADFLSRHNITNYELLGSSSALLTDYSSVYYDYLLTDKPIGLCWDDFDSYNEREGFTVNPYEILAGGEKIYNADNLCAFLERIASDKDQLREKRNEIKRLVHLHVDNQSTKRVVDYLEMVLERGYPTKNEPHPWTKPIKRAGTVRYIGIINLQHTKNYGASIAAVALEKTVRRLVADKGLQVQTVYYSPRVPKDDKLGQFIWNIKEAGGLLNYIKKQHKKPSVPQRTEEQIRLRRDKFEAFHNKYLNRSNYFTNARDIASDINYEAFIVGSDVVWHPKRSNSFCSDGYFLKFANKGEKRISYAASLDTNNQKLRHLRGCYRNNLKYMDNISVREKESIAFLQPLTEKKLFECCDPVLLCHAEDYEPMLQDANLSPHAEDYIYVYILDKCDSIVAYANNLKKEKQLKICYYAPNYSDFGTGAEDCYFDSPAEFLHRVKYASYVLTNSYHCMIFSVLFEKNFLVFDRGKTSIKTKALLSELDLTDRIFTPDSPADIDRPIPFPQAKEKIEHMRNTSLVYLENSLKDI